MAERYGGAPEKRLNAGRERRSPGFEISDVFPRKAGVGCYDNRQRKIAYDRDPKTENRIDLQQGSESDPEPDTEG